MVTYIRAFSGKSGEYNAGVALDVFCVINILINIGFLRL